jgi:hypothetical protein
MHQILNRLIPSVLLLAFLVRFCCSLGELSLDEIWSLSLLSTISEWSDIFFKINHDNNHIINSLWMYAIGFEAPSWLYRFLAVVTGTLAVWVLCQHEGAKHAGSTQTSSALAAALLLGSSYVLIVYSSEARGYGLMMLGLALAYRELSRMEYASEGLLLSSASTRYNGYVTLAFLGHATALQAVPAFILYSIVQCLGKERLIRVLPKMFFLHAPILLVASIYALLIFPGLELGGGPQTAPLEVVLNSLASLLGLGEISPLAIQLGALQMLAALILFLICCFAVQAEWKRGERADAAFFFVMCIFLPFMYAFVYAPPVFFVRYLLPSLLFSLLLVSRFLGRHLTKPGIGRYVAILALLTICTGQFAGIRSLLTHGRSGLGELLAEAAKQNGGIELAVFGEPQFRARLMVTHHALFEKAAAYFVDDPKTAEWFLMQSQDSFFVFPDTLNSDGVAFKLWGSRESAPLSGIRMVLYRRVSQ